MNPIKIAVVTVNYGTPNEAIDAVQSVLSAENDGAIDVQMYLVDNASPDDSAQRFEEASRTNNWTDRVALFLESTNHGYGRGNNVVLEHLSRQENKPKYVFFLNPDAAVLARTLVELVSFMETHSEVSVAGASIVRQGTDRLVSAAFNFPSLGSEVFSGAPIGLLSRVFSIQGVNLPPDAPEGPVDWVSGAGFIASFEALERVGFFDPSFFLYFEEMDLMKRVQGQVYYYPKAQITHIAGAATGLVEGRRKNKRLPAYWFDSWRIYFSKHYGRFGAFGIGLARVAAYGAHATLTFIRRRPSPHADRFGRDFVAQALMPLVFHSNSQPK